MELDQMVIPIFYGVDPSDIRKQTGEFGKVFEKTCKGKTKDQRRKWMQALAEVANMAGEDLQNWPNEADMIDKIADDVSNKLMTPSNTFGDFVGIEAHIKAMDSILCLESEEARMVGIVGPSGIGKSTIGRALFSQLSRQFHYRAFLAYKRTIQDDYGMKLCWEEQFLSEILGQKELKISQLGAVERRLKHKKVIIVLDDVDDLELLKTLVGQTGWFGSGSRIIVITQDRQILHAHKIDLIYEVKFPSEDLALKMFCRSAFGKNSPPDSFMELAVKVAKLAGNLPLGLSVLGSSFRGRSKDEWMKMLPRYQNGLDGKIEKILRVGYDRLDGKDQELFLFIAFACLFDGMQVSDIKDLLGESVNTGLTILADKSLIRITTPYETVEMHNLLQKLGKEIVRSESINNPGKLRYLVDVEDIRDVLTDTTGTETVLGIFLNTLDIKEPFPIDEKSFQGMRNLQFLIVGCYVGPPIQMNEWYSARKVRMVDLKAFSSWRLRTSAISRSQRGTLHLPQGLIYLPRKLRLLKWDKYPSKFLPSNFKAGCLVELSMKNSSLEKLWEGTLTLGSLKKLIMSCSTYLKELPDLSTAKNLEEVYIDGCTSLVTFPSSIQNLLKLRELNLEGCTELESFPTLVNLKSLEYLNLRECSRLRNFPQIYMNSSPEISIQVEDCFWNQNLCEPDYLSGFMRCMPCKVRPEHLKCLIVRGNMVIEKLWEGLQSLGSLEDMDLSGCENLTEIPDLSKAINLECLRLKNCVSLVKVPCTIGNLNKLVLLIMEGCTKLEILPTDVNLSSLETLHLGGCSRLTSFPQISQSIKFLYLNKTAIEQVPCCIGNFSRLSVLMMRDCKRLKNVSPNIFRLRSLKEVYFAGCGEVTLSDAIVVAAMPMEDLPIPSLYSKEPFEPTTRAYFALSNCLKLDGDARALIQRSFFRPTVLSGGEVPTYFRHRASGNSVTVPKISVYRRLYEFNACVVVEPLTNPKGSDTFVRVRWHFDGLDYQETIFAHNLESYETDHLVLGSFKFRPIGRPYIFECNDVEFEFSFNHQRIKGCGVTLSEIFSAPNGFTRQTSLRNEVFAVWPNFTIHGMAGSESGTYVTSERRLSLRFF